MMLTPASSPASVSDSSLTSRVKPLEAPSAVTMATPGQVPMAPLAAQSLTEVSIHKTVIPPPRLSPPLCPVSLCRPPPVSPGLGHPREGQTASLLGGKYILLDELEGSTLHRCLDINSHEELVCKVSVVIILIMITVSVIVTRCDLYGHMSVSACAVVSLVGSQHTMCCQTAAQLVHFLPLPPPLCQLCSVYHNSDKTLITLLTRLQSAQSSSIVAKVFIFERASVLTILMDGLIPEKRLRTLLLNNFLFNLWLQISPGPVRWLEKSARARVCDAIGQHKSFICNIINWRSATGC